MERQSKPSFCASVVLTKWIELINLSPGRYRLRVCELKQAERSIVCYERQPDLVFAILKTEGHV